MAMSGDICIEVQTKGPPGKLPKSNDLRFLFISLSPKHCHNLKQADDGG